MNPAILDDLIKDEAGFLRALGEAAKLAARRRGLHVTMGIWPSYAETGYGYMELAGQATDAVGQAVAAETGITACGAARGRGGDAEGGAGWELTQPSGIGFVTTGHALIIECNCRRRWRYELAPEEWRTSFHQGRTRVYSDADRRLY